MTSPLQELAKEALAMLDAQQAYFKCSALYNAEEKGRLLTESKRLERALRARCEAIVNPNATPNLFDVMEDAS